MVQAMAIQTVGTPALDMPQATPPIAMTKPTTYSMNDMKSPNG